MLDAIKVTMPLIVLPKTLGILCFVQCKSFNYSKMKDKVEYSVKIAKDSVLIAIAFNIGEKWLLTKIKTRRVLLLLLLLLL